MPLTSTRHGKHLAGKIFALEFDVKRVDTLGTRGFRDAKDIVSRKGVLIACNLDRDLHFDCTLTLVYLYLNILSHKEHGICPHRLTSWAFDNCAGFQVEARAVSAAGYD